MTGTLMVSLIHDYTSKKTNWIPNGNLNSGKLEYYYLFVSGLQVINLIYYFICTKFYTYKVVEEASDRADDGYAELATDDDNITSTPVEQVRGNGETLM
ncbi:hypothetical protein HYC85_025219 [Camellia sinensis]|uniref:Uncharacterized protein n=1 Tax=Camellia sinensis TaxID=4442 RepID=A0A7J7GAD5_CAMSI|nr:hypothetical protein HYC85_025219 [Camellia sinensis]